MIIINFSGHPLTEIQKATIASEKIGETQQLIDVSPHFDQQRPFPAQIQAIVDSVPLTSAEWQQHRILVVPPGLAPATAVLLAELHGRLGHFPEIIRIRPDHDAPEPYIVAEIINLQNLRDIARTKRT